MSKKLAKILRTEMSASLPMIAKLLESKGRNRDTILAHITEEEAELLKSRGGSGTINPETGLLEFYQGGGTTSYYGEAGQYTPDTTYYGSAAQGMPAAQSFPMPTVDYSSYGGGYYGDAAPAAAAAPTTSLYDRFPLPSQDTFGFKPTAVTDFRPSAFDAAQAITPPSLQKYAGDLTIPTPTGATQDPGFTDRLAKSLGISKGELFKLGVGGLTGLAGAYQARQAAEQGQQARRELGAMAGPYRQRGQQLLTSAERGELTPVGQQQLQAMQARLAQGVEGRGGVGAQQAQAQINAYRDQLIQAQYDLGLRVLNVADSISAGAIRAGLQADRYVNELTNNYMTNIARTVYGAAPQAMQREG